MRIDFDDDAEDGRNDLALHHYFALFCIALALAGVACWIMCIEQMEPMAF